jgi:hypothetical protein
MVEVVYTTRADHSDYGGGQPLIHIHHAKREVHGNSIAIKVYGEMKIASGERVWAKELKVNTIQVLTLTAEVPHNMGHGYIAQKHIHNKGEYDNWASIEIYDDAGTWQGANRSLGPYDGSHWLNFDALCE